MIVLDCSYMLAMVMPDESRPADLDLVLRSRLFAPLIWPLEVANALRNVVRRRRLADADVPTVCERIEAHEVEIAAIGDHRVRGHYLSATRHELTTYDALYLELALQRRCALATLDAGLAMAARRAGVTVLD